jgi:putative CRISPR-associated protein (TIGR02620 family)
MIKPDIIVSRHKGLVQYLQEEGIVDEDIDHVEHADREDVEGRHVVGNLPSRLAAKAASLTEIDLNYPENYRGESFDADQVRQYSEGLTTYLVSEIDEELKP